MTFLVMVLVAGVVLGIIGMIIDDNDAKKKREAERKRWGELADKLATQRMPSTQNTQISTETEREALQDLRQQRALEHQHESRMKAAAGIAGVVAGAVMMHHHDMQKQQEDENDLMRQFHEAYDSDMTRLFGEGNYPDFYSMISHHDEDNDSVDSNEYDDEGNYTQDDDSSDYDYDEDDDYSNSDDSNDWDNADDYSGNDDYDNGFDGGDDSGDWF